MADEDTTTVDEDVEPLTGSGAPPEVEEHPEPTSLGFVRQDNVSEPGVQHTHSIDGKTSSHGEPTEKAEAPAEVDEEADGGDHSEE